MARSGRSLLRAYLLPLLFGTSLKRRQCGWLQRLQYDEVTTMFDRKRCEEQGFVFAVDAESQITSVKLDGIGPKLLLSDMTTADEPFLRWRLELTGNNAVEFGTVPVTLQVRGCARMDACKKR